MVFKKIQKALTANDEKYEVLYHKYSQVKIENTRLKKNHLEELSDYKHKLQKKVAIDLMKLYDSVEDAKASSFKVNAVDKDLQRLLMDVNKSEKDLKAMMKAFSMEEVTGSERFYDPELHEVASYQAAKGMAKGLIMKTVKKGFKFKGELLRKPRVVVTK